MFKSIFGGAEAPKPGPAAQRGGASAAHHQSPAKPGGGSFSGGAPLGLPPARREEPAQAGGFFNLPSFKDYALETW